MNPWLVRSAASVDAEKWPVKMWELYGSVKDFDSPY
jgi:hypothetical protein